MANCGLPLFQGYLYVREEGGEAVTQRPGFLSEKTNTEKKHIFVTIPKKMPGLLRYFQAPPQVTIW